MPAPETEVIRTIPRMMEAFSKSMEEVTRIIIALAEQHRDNELVNKLITHEHDGGHLDFTACRSFAYGDLDRKLTENNIPHSIVHDKQTGLVLIVTRDVDREAVTLSKTQMLQEQSRISRVSIPEFNKINAGKVVDEIRGTLKSPAEVKLFQEQAKRLGFVIAAERNKDGTYSAYYAASDRAKAQLALKRTILAKSGHSGKQLLERTTKELTSTKSMLRNMESQNKEFYIVSAANTNEYLHFNKNGYQHFRNGVLVREEQRSNSAFLILGRNQLMGVVRPVMVSKDAFESLNKGVLAREIRENMPRVQKTARDIEIAKIEQMARTLAEYKMSLDNSEQQEIPSSFYNPNVSFFEFAAIEQVNDEHEREKLEAVVTKLEELSEEDRAIAKAAIKEAMEDKNEISIREVYIDPEKAVEDDLDIEIEKIRESAYSGIITEYDEDERSMY